MSWKSLACMAALGAMASSAAAQTITVVDEGSGAGRVDVTTTDDLAVAVEVALEFLGGLSLETATINGTLFDDANPGDNPFIAGSPVGGDTTGLDADDTDNTLFAAYGAPALGIGTFKLLDFTYTSSGTIDADWNVAQSGANNLDSLDGIVFGEVDPGVPGDTDGDGDIDLTDLNNVQNNFGAASPPALGDTDGDGDIDLTDLNNVQNNFGATSAGQAIPEPTTIALLILAGATTFCGRRS